MNRLFISISILLLTTGVEARFLRIPRNANAAPKTLADQEQENAKVQQKLQKKTDTPNPAQPTTSPSNDDLSKAQANLTKVERRLRAAFEKSDDYIKASTDLKNAQDAYELAYHTSATRLTDKSEYTAAVQNQHSAEQALADARANGQSDIPTLATNVMDAKKAVHQLESDAADKDPDVKAAKAKVADAKTAFDSLQKNFTDTMKSDPDYVAAAKAVDDARPQKT